MKEDLTLNIGTKYKGDGFKKVDQQLKATAKTVGTASRAIGAISSELGQMEGAVGKAAGAFSGLISTIATGGGPIALAIAGITTAIAFVIKAFKDAKEASKEAAQTMRESFSNAIDAIAGRISGIQEFFTNQRKQIDKGYSRADKTNELEKREANASNSASMQEAYDKTTDKYEKAIMKVQESQLQALNATEEKLAKALNNVEKVKTNISTTSGEIDKLRGELADMEHKASQQFVSTVDAGVAKEYKTLQENLNRAQEQALRNGKDAVARKETQTISTGTTSSGVVMTKQVEVSITYAQEMEAAAKKLNEFKKKNEESLKALEAYNKSAEEIEKLQKQIKAKA